MNIEPVLQRLEQMFAETQASKWINSPEVAAWCHESRKEREAEESAVNDVLHERNTGAV